MAIRRLACIAGSAVVIAGGASFVDAPFAAAAGGPTALRARITPYTTPHAGVDVDSGITGHSELVTSPKHAVVTVQVAGLEPGRTYGVHVHLGTCAAYLGHYKYDPAQTTATRANEVWLDVLAGRAGHGADQVIVRPLDTSGPLSVVIHKESNPDIPPNVTGQPQPGPREACGDYVPKHRGR